MFLQFPCSSPQQFLEIMVRIILEFFSWPSSKFLFSNFPSIVSILSNNPRKLHLTIMFTRYKSLQNLFGIILKKLSWILPSWNFPQNSNDKSFQFFFNSPLDLFVAFYIKTIFSRTAYEFISEFPRNMYLKCFALDILFSWNFVRNCVGTVHRICMHICLEYRV